MRLQRSSLVTAAAAVFLAAPPAVAQWNNITSTDFQLVEAPYSGLIAKLDNEPALRNKAVADVIADADHKAHATKPSVKHLVSAYTWESSPKNDDVNTRFFVPQSITTSYDAVEGGVYKGNKIHLISWHSDGYDDGKRGARISFVDANDPDHLSYREVLLVEPTGSADDVANFRAIAGLHTGGMFWYGDLLYVVAAKGFLIFDLNHIYEVDMGNGIGRVGDGYQAYNFK